MIPDIYHGDAITDYDEFFGASDFVILKATQGDYFVDDAYAERAAQATARGVAHWAYTFFVDGPSGPEQAQYLIDHVADPVGLIIDVEDYHDSLASAEAVTEAARYIVASGYKCGIYFMDSEGDQFGGISSIPEITDYTFSWVARYGVNDGTLSREPEHGCSLHQYTSAGDMPGVAGGCDLSRVTGTGFDLDWFTRRKGEQPGYSTDAAISRGRDIIGAWCEYSQDDRWDDDPLRRDCSSFVIDCVRSGGIALEDGYTGSLYDQLTETGWTAHDFDGNLSDCERGGILLRSRDLHPDGNPPGHVCMVSESGSNIIECGSTPAAERGIYDDSWDWFLSPPTVVPVPIVTPHQPSSSPVNDAGLTYHSHVQDLGWLDTVRDGQISGTAGYGLRMEAIIFDEIPSGFRFGMKLHIQDTGWVDCGEVHAGDVLGTTGIERRVECILPYIIENTTGKVPKFSCHVQDYGWETSTGFDYAEGSTGESRRIEAVRFWLE